MKHYLTVRICSDAQEYLDKGHTLGQTYKCAVEKKNETISLFRTFSKKDHFFGQKISKILCLAFDFICIYYMSSDY